MRAFRAAYPVATRIPPNSASYDSATGYRLPCSVRLAACPGWRSSHISTAGRVVLIHRHAVGGKVGCRALAGGGVEVQVFVIPGVDSAVLGCLQQSAVRARGGGHGMGLIREPGAVTSSG